MKKIIESGKSHNYALGIFLFDYRTTTHKTSGATPARLMIGRELRNRFSLLRPAPIYQNLVEAQEKQLKYAKGARILDLSEGDLVNVKDFRRGKKWSKGHIVKVLMPGSTFMVEVEGAKWKRHANQLHKL